jgi:hypothetical protein
MSTSTPLATLLLLKSYDRRLWYNHDRTEDVEKAWNAKRESVIAASNTQPGRGNAQRRYQSVTIPFEQIQEMWQPSEKAGVVVKLGKIARALAENRLTSLSAMFSENFALLKIKSPRAGLRAALSLLLAFGIVEMS